MAGGTWKRQDKKRAGAYIDVVSNGSNLQTASIVGVVTIPLAINFGPENKVVTLTNDMTLTEFGYTTDDEQMLLVREALKRASKVLAFRVGTGEKATKTEGTLTITAKYTGSRGNDITVVSKAMVDVADTFNVQTFLGGTLVDTQSVTKYDDLVENEFVTFSGSGTAQAFTTRLADGSDTQAQIADYKKYFEAIRLYDFNTMALAVTDTTIKSAAASFINRLREDEGDKRQLVVAKHTVDDEAVINVKNGVVLSDGTKITPEQATAWVAGASAAAGIDKSLTYDSYDGAVDVTERYLNSEIEAALDNGEFIFVEKRGKVIVEQDINSLHTFSAEKDKSFSKNRVLRVLDDIANNTKRAFEDYFIGKVDNNVDGRELFKANRITYLNELQVAGAIQNFKADDVVVEPGIEKDSIIMNFNVQPVDALEKLYLKVVVQ